MSSTIFQGLTNISIILTLLILIYQVQHATSSYRKNIDIKKRNQAIELSKLYAESIIPKISYVSAVYRELEIEDKLKTIKYTQLKHFNKKELESLLDQEIIKKSRELSSLDPQFLLTYSFFFKDICVENKILYRSILSNDTGINPEDIDMENLTKDQIFMLRANLTSQEILIILHNEFKSLQHTVLNELEYFSMYFVNGLADKEVVYQSLHQSFLSVVKVMYISISSININSHEKYYTNLISLYCDWAKEKEKKENEELEKSDSILTSKPPIK